jgi:peptidoglycan/LPS O-acetylase OafA/YrhL
MDGSIPSRPPARGGALDALRFLAAAFIVVFHAGDTAPVPLRDLHDVFARGYLATDFFLMLSGFVLARIYGEAVLSGRVSPGQFFVKRAARNYPAHLITLAALVVMVLVAGALGHTLSHPEQFPWAALPAHLLMMHGWGFAPDTWNAPTWSISALFVCYAGFPWIWPMFHQLRRTATCVLTAIGLLAGADVAAHLLAGQPLFNLPFQWGLFRTIPLFLTGLALARLTQVAEFGPNAGQIALAGVLALAANILAIGPDAISILAIGAVIAGSGAMAASRPWPGAALGAKISFSLFFTHTLALAAFSDVLRPLLERLGPGVAGQWLIWWGSLAFAGVAAAGYHYLIDEPVQRQLRRVLFRRSPGLHPAPAPSA